MAHAESWVRTGALLRAHDVRETARPFLYPFGVDDSHRLHHTPVEREIGDTPAAVVAKIER